MAKSPAPFDQGLFLMHLHKGKEFFDQDQLQKAREELEAAYHLRPQDEKVLNMLGMTYYKLEMLPQAEEMYVILAGGNPDVYALQSNLGLIQLKLNKLEQARDSLNRALELQPANSKAHFYMGLLYEKEEMWEEALYHFEQANAEKMIAKMQARLDEQRNSPELVLPFQVMEVLNPQAESDPVLSTIVQEEMRTDGEDVIPEEEITGRIQTQDLASALFHIEDEPRPEEPLEMSAENAHSEEVVFDYPPEDNPIVAEEDILGESADLITEKMKEEIHEQDSWEKTHPSLFPDVFVEPEPEQNETNLLISPSMDEPFLLSEDIAADISTFLAQSRTEETPEEDVFYQENALPELTIIKNSTPSEIEESPTEQNEERIPTPEEIENEIRESESSSEPSFLKEEPESETPKATPVEEPVEELSEEILTENIQEIQKPQPEEEDLEVNFAVNESEEENQVTEGFLQPSYLTPEVEEKQLEQTQDMDYSTQEQEVVKSDAETTEAESLPEPEAQDAIASTEVKEPSEQTLEQDRAANLDQFSRDRLYIQPLLGSDRFLLIDPHLLEIIISEKLVCRIGTISSYTGNLQFASWMKESNEKAPFILVEGTGILFLADRRKEIFLISLNHEEIFVESNHLLVAQSNLKIEPQVFQNQNTGNQLSILKISGRGTLALTCLTKPLTVNVHEGLPANIPAQAVIAWSGRVVSEVLEDADLRKVMMSRDEESMLLRFRGTGDVVVEQGGLWGDRRTKRI
jgi:uncharacterized protein (AIM24 family)/tetratricopeptide (TPR) repeat protein